MKVGFTGTQDGMTPKQFCAVGRRLKKLNEVSAVTELHHGDCVGADAEVHGIALMDFSNIVLHIHPPVNERKRAFSLGDEKRIVMYEAKEYMDRNHDIVDATEILIATPKEKEEQVRSGTWATFRYGKKRNRDIYVIYPDGAEDVIERSEICLIRNDGTEIKKIL